jgi:hypothetical protein
VNIGTPRKIITIPDPVDVPSVVPATPAEPVKVPVPA